MLHALLRLEKEVYGAERGSEGELQKGQAEAAADSEALVKWYCYLRTIPAVADILLQTGVDEGEELTFLDQGSLGP